MNQEQKKLIELIEFHVNDKAKTSSSFMSEEKDIDKKQFHLGQYMAFNEIYSMLQNIKKTY